MQCLYCGKRIAAGWDNQIADFCSADHRALYYRSRTGPSQWDNGTVIDLQPAGKQPVPEPIVIYGEPEQDVALPRIARSGSLGEATSFRMSTPRPCGEMYQPGWLRPPGAVEVRLPAPSRLPHVEACGKGWLAHGRRLVQAAFDRMFSVRGRAAAPARAVFAPEEQLRPAAQETLASAPRLSVKPEIRTRHEYCPGNAEPASKAQWNSRSNGIAGPRLRASHDHHGMSRPDVCPLALSTPGGNPAAIRMDGARPLPATIGTYLPAPRRIDDPECRSAVQRYVGAEPTAPPTGGISVGGQPDRGSFSVPEPAFFGEPSVGLGLTPVRVRAAGDPRRLPVPSGSSMEAPQVIGDTFVKEKVAVRPFLGALPAAVAVKQALIPPGVERNMTMAPHQSDATGGSLPFATRAASAASTSIIPGCRLTAKASFRNARMEPTGSTQGAACRQRQWLYTDRPPAVHTRRFTRKDWVRGEILLLPCPADRPVELRVGRTAPSKQSLSGAGEFWPKRVTANPRSPRLTLQQEERWAPQYQSWAAAPVFRGRWSRQAGVPAVRRKAWRKLVSGLPRGESRIFAAPAPTAPAYPAMGAGAREPLITWIITVQLHPIVQTGPKCAPGDFLISRPRPVAPERDVCAETAPSVHAMISAIPSGSTPHPVLGRQELPAGCEIPYAIAGIPPGRNVQATPEQLFAESALCSYSGPQVTRLTAARLLTARAAAWEINPHAAGSWRSEIAIEPGIIVGPLHSFPIPSPKLQFAVARSAEPAAKPMAPLPAQEEAVSSQDERDRLARSGAPVIRAAASAIPRLGMGSAGEWRVEALQYAVPLGASPTEFRSACPACPARRLMKLTEPLAGFVETVQPRESIADSELLEVVADFRDLRRFSFSVKELPTVSSRCATPGWQYERDYMPLDPRWQRNRTMWNRGARWKGPVKRDFLPGANLRVVPE